ncbi:MAG: hypothetical protein EA422_08520 [Gemmatimonadales bacterium]|nr:MAG: hypothetical protein EA422_08520 [Gemmatimonadales bacterium]
MADGKDRKGRGTTSRRRRDQRDSAGRRTGRDGRSHRSAGAGGSPEAPDLTGPLDRIPLWLTLVVFGAVTLGLFREFVFSDQMLVGQDTLALGYMARAFFADALQTTGFPLWNPIILGGTPFLESLAGGDSLHPISVGLLFVMETYRALGWKLVIHVFLAGVGMYGWLRTLQVSRGAALIGGLGFLLAPYMVTLAFPGHDGKIFVTAMTPFLFWTLEWFLARRGWLPLAAMAGVIALVILSTHFQMAYFLFGAAGVYMAVRCLQLAQQEGEGKGPAGAGSAFGAFLLFSVLGAGITAVQLLPAVDYVTEHSRRAATTVEADAARGVAFSSSWSLHPEEALSLAVPEFIGNSAGTAEWTTDTYWGRNPFKLNHEYLGLVLLLLASLSFAGGRLPWVRWSLTGIGLTALLFALGQNTPVWRVFYEVVPGISLFRAPSMAIFITGFVVATLAALGVDRGARLVEEGKGATVLKILGSGVALLALGWLLAITGALSALWTSVLYRGITPAQLEALGTAEPHIVRGFGVAVVLTALVAGVWAAVSRRLLPAVLLVPSLALLVAVDQWRVNEPFLEVMDYRSFAAADANIQFLLDRQAEEDPFRVLSFARAGQDVEPGMHGLELAAGHHPNDLGRYRDLIGMEGSGLPENLARFNPNLLAVLNIRYILWPDFQFGPLEGSEPVSALQFADGRIFTSVHPSPTLPRARVVGDALVVDPHQTLATVLDLNRYDPSVQVVLEEEPPIQLGGRQIQGQVSWIDRTPNRLVFEVTATGPALVALAENWFPAWRATVDGSETPVLRADHALRAVAVPGGTHRVEMWFDAPLVRIGLWISLLSLVLVVAAAAVDPIRRRGSG